MTLVRRLAPALRVILVLVVLAYVVGSVNIASALHAAAGANAMLVLVSVMVLTSVHVLAALTWRHIGSGLGAPRIGRWSAIRAYYASQAIGGLTPANLGGDAYRVVALRTAGSGWADAAGGVLVQRATSFAALGLIGVVALLALPDVATTAVPLLVAAGLITIIAAFPMGLVVRRLTGAIASAAFVRASASGLILGLLFHGLAIGASYLLVLAVDPTSSGIAVVAAVALARLAIAVPVTPSGLGIQEGAMAALFIVLGLDPAVAVAATLLGRLGLLATTVIGLGIIAIGRRSQPAASGTAFPATAPAIGLDQ
jgi:uncharacterized membrane protein YbhN (UPF0104 family)